MGGFEEFFYLMLDKQEELTSSMVEIKRGLQQMTTARDLFQNNGRVPKSAAWEDEFEIKGTCRARASSLLGTGTCYTVAAHSRWWTSSRLSSASSASVYQWRNSTGNGRAPQLDLVVIVPSTVGKVGTVR